MGPWGALETEGLFQSGDKGKVRRERDRYNIARSYLERCFCTKFFVFLNQELISDRSQGD